MKKLIFSVSTLVLISCVSQPSKVSSSKGCETLGSDLDYIHSSINANFAGTTHNPELRRQADAVFLEERSHASQCLTDIDAQRSLRKYFAAFHDPHVKAAWSGIARYGGLVETSSGKKIDTIRSFPLAATGVYVVNLGGRFFVRKIDSHLLQNTHVLANDELLSCDGKAAPEILDQRVLPFEPVSVKNAARYRMAPLIFIRWDQKAGSTTTCLFKRGDESFSETMTWTTVPENYLAAKFELQENKIYEVEKLPHGHWVKLRSFAGYDEAGIAQLKRFSDDAKKLRQDKVIVVDVRGNTGGNSIWGTRWIENLFGYHADSASEENLVLASPGNFGHFSRLHESLAKKGAIQPEDEARWSNLLTAAKDRPGKLVKVDDPKPIDKTTHSLKNTFKGKIYVLTDFMVFSSGETFVHELKMMPNVKQVGMATNASTYYSDIRFDITPSGLVFNFPTMVEFDPSSHRASGEPLVPEIQLSLKPEIEIQGKDSLREQVLHLKL
jgi:hypothetical protein